MIQRNFTFIRIHRYPDIHGKFIVDKVVAKVVKEYKAGKVELTEAGVRLKKTAGAGATGKKAKPLRQPGKKKARCSGDKNNAPKDGGF